MKITYSKLILFAALFFVTFDNFVFFRHVLDVYPLSLKNIGFLASLVIGLACIIILLLTLVSSRYTIKPVLIVLLIAAALADYFMKSYNMVIDSVMIQNILQTNINETSDLLSTKLFASIFFYGLLPAFFVYIVKIEVTTWRKLAISKVKVCATCVVVVCVMILCFSKFYTSFFREHKPLRYYTNPTYFIYSTGEYLGKRFNNRAEVVAPLGEDAQIPKTDTGRELIILVVGEAARADHFALNGYLRETNPLLAREDVISLPAMYSCGTSTAYSVPCIFSVFGRRQYSDTRGKCTENLLDVLQHAGVNVLWRDNNSDSKGVAVRVEYQNYQKRDINPVCDRECRDEGMLVGLQEYINNQREGDILIVLHQMGNHGPAYYKRYPESFEKFTPSCRTSQFDECTNVEIVNAYDNALLYTDFFLSQVIKLLKQNDSDFETAMVYLSDHGESLGEYGIYLHGLPYAMAPEAQKHIGAFLWFGENFEIDRDSLRRKALSQRFSQDNLFHTILGMMEIDTVVYDKELDIISR